MLFLRRREAKERPRPRHSMQDLDFLLLFVDLAVPSRTFVKRKRTAGPRTGKNQGVHSDSPIVAQPR